jgi:hypothetical protein
MRNALLLFSLMLPTVFGEKQELGLTLGGLFPRDRGIAPNAIRLGGGVALQANYGFRLWEGSKAALYGEVHFLANQQQVVTSTNTAATQNIASVYIIPGIRLKFNPKGAFSPYLAVGGGLADYEQSTTRIDGTSNQAPRQLRRGVFDYGAGGDVKFWRWLGLRGEIRDFYAGSPAYNLPGLGGGQHNVVAGGGFVIKWGD